MLYDEISQDTRFGLAAGTYTLTGMTLANCNNINSFDTIWTGRLVIPDTSINVPEPATLALFAMGLLGFGIAKRTCKI